MSSLASTPYPYLVEELAVSFGSSVLNDKTASGDFPPSVTEGLLDLPVDSFVFTQTRE
jgi:hypothetical protein